jgi:thymidylate synthase
MLNPIFIEATTLSDAWFQSIYKCIEVGRSFTIDTGSFAGQKRLEFDWATIRIKYPSTLPLLPKLNPMSGLPDPVEDGYINEYLPYLMTNEEKEGESYTYGQRICAAPTDKMITLWDTENGRNIYIQDEEVWASLYNGKSMLTFGSDGKAVLNQMEMMIHTYKKYGFRNNQMIVQIGSPSDMLLKDPPCLRHIDTRIQDNKLHFFPYFRSWDLWGGLPANLAAIELMKQYCAEQMGVENGEIIATSKGLHIYDYVFELAEAIRGKTIKEFKEEMI